jgi:hypothetical protein
MDECRVGRRAVQGGKISGDEAAMSIISSARIFGAGVKDREDDFG